MSLGGQLESTAPREAIQTLREQIGRCERGANDQRPRIHSGHTDLDRLLLDGGFRGGTLVEWLEARAGGGADVLAMATVREIVCAGGTVIVVDRRRTFYPPAAAAGGIDLARLVLVRPESIANEHWAIDQALRCPGVAVVWAWPERIDPQTFRRWQLAVRHGGGLGLLVRPAAARREPSWADVRLLVESKKGSGAFCRNGPRPTYGRCPASHKRRLTPFSTGWRLDVAMLRPSRQGTVALEVA